jgi:trimeric autotransporter adhesin
MGRSGSVGLTALALFLLAVGLSGCGSGSATNVLSDEVPASVSLTPATNSSMDVGATQTFTAAAKNRNNAVITDTFTFQSSNPAVATVSSGGAVCAGTWDSLIAPTVCTAGSIGTAQITATARGVSSPPTLVYVHQHVDSIQISVVPSTTNPQGPCISKDQVIDYQASAFSRVGSNLVDITASVGQFTWQAVFSSVVTLKTLTLNSTNQPVLNQVEMTATTPGLTNFSASVSGVNSAPSSFVTCPVEAIQLNVLNDPSTSFVVPIGTSKTVNATVIDFLGHTITGVPLTWSSSSPTSVTATGATSTLFGSVGTVSTPAVGAASVIASCTPPTCNVGFYPSRPIYPQSLISLVVTGATTGNSTSYSLYVTSKGTGVDATSQQPWSCATTVGCFDRVIPITASTAGTNTVGSAIGLPEVPNTLVYEAGGTAAYMGVDSGKLGTRGLMTLTASSNALAQQVAAPGKVLAVSPDGKTVIVSDVVDTPNQVFIANPATNSVAATLHITGATAASFSPDNFRAYILAGNQLYVYSTIDALQTVQLGSAGFVANDVAFLPIGAFAFISGGPPDTVTAYATCTNTIALAPHTGVPQVVPTPGNVSMLRPLPNGAQVLAMDSPTIDYIDVSTSPDSCPPAVTAAFAGSVNLGQGNFVPTQFLISPDGLTAYILTQGSGAILVFNIANRTTSAISLTGNAIALQASVTPDGRFLYVGAEDVPPPTLPTSPPAMGSVHVLDTTAGADVQQITFPETPQPFCIGQGTPPLAPPSPVTYCYPDLIAVKP